jgi:cobalt-zinc-cadmium efflux system outer membrane protein
MRYRSEAVAPSADLLRIAESAYRAGESTVLELLDAYKGALEAELTALDLEWKARDARIELDQLTGNHPQ